MSNEIPTQPTPIKLWTCAAGHVLGHVVRRGGIRRLKVYRLAVEPGHPGRVLGTLTGEMEDIECSICGRERTWVPGQEGIDELVARMRNGRHT